MAQERIPITRAGDVTLPLVKILTGRGFVTGKSGSGKSNSVNVIVEETLDLGRPMLIIDTDGEYWGLKEQYRVLHLGNDDRCDAKITAADADTIVDVALHDGVPVILDISGFLREEDADEVVHRVVKTLFQEEKQYREPFLLIAEEVHEYIPEKGGMTDAGETLIQVAKRGRKHGLGFIGVSQRPASVDKDFITQCDWITWHRLTWKNDTEVVRTILGADAAREVEDLDPGEGLLMTDWDEHIERVQFRKKRTFDAGQTPGFGEFDPPSLLPVGAAVLERFGVEGEELPEDVQVGLAGEDVTADDGAEAAVTTTETADEDDAPTDAETEPTALETPAGDGGAPEVVEAEPVTEEEEATTASAPTNRPAPGRGRPTPDRGRRRQRPPPDQPAVVEFGQMVIYLTRRVGGAIGRGVGAIFGALGGRVAGWWRGRHFSEDDLVVLGWLLLGIVLLAVLGVLAVVGL